MTGRRSERGHVHDRHEDDVVEALCAQELLEQREPHFVTHVVWEVGHELDDDTCMTAH